VIPQKSIDAEISASIGMNFLKRDKCLLLPSAYVNFRSCALTIRASSSPSTGCRNRRSRCTFKKPVTSLHWGPFVKLLVLVVHDEPDVEMLFRQQFRHDLRAGRLSMEFVQSAPRALERISSVEDVSIILILSDINMPGMSGLELLPKAKAARPDVPIIMITAYGDAETKRKVLEGGAEALFTKPIDFSALRNEIDARVMRAA